MLETRRARRYACDETVDCEAWGKVRYAVLKDISMLGARLQGTGLPEVGSVVRIAPSFFGVQRTWVYCQVAWIRRGDVDEAGLRFLEPAFRLRRTWVGEFVAGTSPVERRRAIRVPTEVHLEVKIEGSSRTLEATSLDLSRGGAQLSLDRPLRRCDFLKLHLCLPWTLLEVPAMVIRRLAHDRPEHSVRFLEMPPGDQEALGSFIKEELDAAQEPGPPPGISFLKVVNDDPGQSL